MEKIELGGRSQFFPSKMVLPFREKISLQMCRCAQDGLAGHFLYRINAYYDINDFERKSSYDVISAHKCPHYFIRGPARHMYKWLSSGILRMVANYCDSLTILSWNSHCNLFTKAKRHCRLKVLFCKKKLESRSRMGPGCLYNRVNKSSLQDWIVAIVVVAKPKLLLKNHSNLNVLI